MDQIQRVLKQLLPKQSEYSEAFKKQIVREYERGNISKEALRLKYNLGGNSTVLEWCRKYGKFAYEHTKPQEDKMTDPNAKRIKELEARLKDAELRLKVYAKWMEVSKRDMSAEAQKKIDDELWKSLGGKKA